MKNERFANIMVGAFSSIGILILIGILFFVFTKGLSGLSIDFLISDYHQTQYNTTMSNPSTYTLDIYQDPNKENVYFSTRWGVGFSEKVNSNKETIVYVSYIDSNSPLLNMNDKTDSSNYVTIKNNYRLVKVSLEYGTEYYSAYSRQGAEKVRDTFDSGNEISTLVLETGGGGIRGSLVTTFLLIVLTLVIALPLGIAGAIFLHEYAKDNLFKRIITIMIDLTSGIPSIIFGLVGAIIFIPFMNSVIGSKGGSIASGALTMAMILLPIIIKTTEEALIVIPDSYRQASLALGASKTETIFKVILPNAISGILSAVILSIGRIIGESAALIYAIGTTIKDNIMINERSTTLAVHIWSVMSGENPNYEQACSIAIIILATVLILSILVKVLGKKMNKFEVAN